MIGSSGKGSRKSLDFDLNLTSFIDLLSTCTCFLLITAVWVQIGTVEVKQSHGTQAAATTKDSQDLDLVFKSPSEIVVNLKKSGKLIKSINVSAAAHSDMLKKLNDTIVTQIKGEVATATITPKLKVNYGHLIAALDVLRKNKIVNIGVLTEKGQ